ncbi:hypothetical protein KHY84_06435, partial [butyrate-producing bacterium]|nr:hypothetical protein [butyrate-producing bacterium]
SGFFTFFLVVKQAGIELIPANVLYAIPKTQKEPCLSEASCIIFFSSLAVACKPRGTFPESHKHCFLKVPCPANQLKLHENSYFSRKCLTRRNSYVTMFGRMEDIGLFFMLKKR